LHLSNHDVTLWAVARAPLEKLTAYKQRIGWSFPWASSCQADFNFDYQVSITDEQQREGVVPYNYQPGSNDLKSRPPGVAAHAADRGTDAAPPYIRDRPGMNAFVLEDGAIYHTYSASMVFGACISGWIARPRGRNESGQCRGQGLAGQA
jgi:predicted dithiol-disulfide oxidoreductase (DUF899 family)